ncbi:MAG TPA: hydantoinase/oxoprolinase family protein [Gemmataceae bacterium]|nr:hydantoinase/oxoprolinase family protein [Gemmataceae bacterium]
MATSVLGLDVGGANLKAAHGGTARVRPFALWKNPAGLADALRGLLRDLPAFDRLAVTMTGELCDCFESKRQGVHAILDAVAAVAGGAAVRVWRNDGRFVDLATAHNAPLQAASANWLALATFAGRHAPAGPAVLLDIGSTTTDVVPLRDGRPVPKGRTDPERLDCSELVYTGARRTPLCALLGVEAAAEFFATTLDAYLLLGLLPEDAADRDTADGRPATRAAAHARLARMLCADVETSTAGRREELALRVLQKQVHQIGFAVERVVKRLPGPAFTLITAGSGEFLVGPMLRQQRFLGHELRPGKIVSLGEILGPAVSAAACAHAVGVLAAEEM